MKKYLILLLLQIVVIRICAQTNFDSTSFKVSIGDLEATKYLQDSTANALVIYEYGNSYIDKNSFQLVTKIKRKIKILNKKGADNATIEVYLFNSDSKKRKEKIKDIFATTYNLVEGNTVKTMLKKSEIFEDIYDENFTIIKFTLPNIQDGSIITYSYTLESPFIYNFKDWIFQERIPKLYSRYETSIPENYDYNIKLVGSLKLSERKHELKRNCLIAFNGFIANCVNSIYAMKDIPAFIEEDYITTKNNYLSKIKYELKVYKGFDGVVKSFTKTWKTVDKELKTNQNIGKQLNKLSLTKDLLDSNIRNETNQFKKAKAIYEFIQNSYTWNNEYSLFKDVSIKNLIKNKSGKASEINILLHNLLKENGVNVNAVLLSTRKNGLPTKLHPVIADFNYLIVEANINGKLYLLDATDKYLSFGEIPFKCLNDYGRLLDFKNGSRWIDIKINKYSIIQQQINLTLVKEGAIIGKINSRSTGYHALLERKAYFSNPTKYLEDFENEYEYIDVIEHTVKSNNKNDDKFQEYFEIEINDLNIIDGIIYFDPFIFKFFTKNPFQLQQRTYPIDFGYKDSYLYSIEIYLNGLYEIIETPKDMNMKLPNNTGEFIFATKITGDKLTIFFKINFKESSYSAKYYSYIKEFMSKIVDVQTKTLIVLKKK